MKKSRGKIMREIDIEVEVGKGFSFQIVKEIDGFWVDYDAKVFGGWKPSRNDLSWVIENIKRVMKDLNIETPYLARIRRE